MNKLLIIIKREYVVRVRTRAFVIGTIASPLLLLGVAVLPVFIATRGGGERRVTVLDQSGDSHLFEAILKRTESREFTARGDDSDTPGFDREPMQGTRFLLSHRPVPPTENIDEVKRTYREQVEREADAAYLVLRPGVLDDKEPEYYARNISDFSISALRQAVSAAISERRLVRAGFEPKKITDYTKPVDMKRFKITASGESRQDAREGFMVAFILLFFLYMSVLFYGIFVMRGVVEEKQSRIIELIVSSVKPVQMMMGKLVGIGLVGLTQIGIWAGSAALLSMFGASMLAGRGVSIPDIPVSLLVYFVAFFVLGYFLYATLYAMVGAIVSSEEDVQQVQLPVTLLLVVPMMIFSMVMANPNSPSSIALSMIPFFAPTLMMLRIAVINPPAWQVLSSMAIMLATTVGSVWVAAKIYRVGILMHGKRPSIAELGRWLRYT